MNLAATSRMRKISLHIGISLIGIVMLYPVLWLLSSSLKPNALIFTEPGLWPKEITFNNYIKGWFSVRNSNFGVFFWNSAKISLISVLANVITCSMAAYAFARIDFSLKKLWFSLLLLTLMLPEQVTLIPKYILFHELGWINSILPLIAPKFLAVESFFVFLMIQFIRGLPKELDESATIDGCGYTGIYLRIILPLAVPALITTALFTFIWTWDDFFGPLLYLNSLQQFTVPLGLRLFLDSEGQSNWGGLFAMSALSLLPVVIVFFSSQKYFVEGIATTGIKG
ncbi:carbohydrate ABC transporter permease [Paenibacillus sp. FSL H8-0034]|uniref:carbohydrate ABC transporter permease n=1 Tax=Paenibacillus sp. FSL H8-0034 TaxID=2954671 RepID=UPI0030F79DA9